MTFTIFQSITADESHHSIGALKSSLYNFRPNENCSCDSCSSRLPTSLRQCFTAIAEDFSAQASMVFVVALL